MPSWNLNIEHVGTLLFYVEVEDAADIKEAIRALEDTGQVVIDIIPINRVMLQAVFIKVAGSAKPLSENAG